MKFNDLAPVAKGGVGKPANLTPVAPPHPLNKLRAKFQVPPKGKKKMAPKKMPMRSPMPAMRGDMDKDGM